MNVARGLRRIFIVFASGWYVVGGLFVWSAWSDHYSTQKSNLDRCFEAVRGERKQFEDQNGKPLPKLPEGYVLDPPSKTMPLPKGATLVDPGTLYLTEDTCRKAWIKPPIDEWQETFLVAVFPWVVYSAFRVLWWIAKGFRSDQPPTHPA